MRQPPAENEGTVSLEIIATLRRQTFRWRVSNIFGAFLAALARRRVLKMWRALENWASFLHARKLLAIALALHTRIFSQRHFSLLEDILTVQMTA